MKTTVNAAAIAAGLLGMMQTMPDAYNNALGLGMLPAPLFEKLDEALDEELDAELGKSDAAGRKKWKAEVTHAVSLAMLAQAKDAGILVV